MTKIFSTHELMAWWYYIRIDPLPCLHFSQENKFNICVGVLFPYIPVVSHTPTYIFHSFSCMPEKCKQGRGYIQRKESKNQGRHFLVFHNFSWSYACPKSNLHPCIWRAKRKYTTFSYNILLLIIFLTYLTDYDSFLIL